LPQCPNVNKKSYEEKGVDKEQEPTNGVAVVVDFFCEQQLVHKPILVGLPAHVFMGMRP